MKITRQYTNLSLEDIEKTLFPHLKMLPNIHLNPRIALGTPIYSFGNFSFASQLRKDLRHEIRETPFASQLRKDPFASQLRKDSD